MGVALSNDLEAPVRPLLGTTKLLLPDLFAALEDSARTAWTNCAADFGRWKRVASEETRGSTMRQSNKVSSPIACCQCEVARYLENGNAGQFRLIGQFRLEALLHRLLTAEVPSANSVQNRA